MTGIITGFAIIGVLVAAGYLCARLRIGGGKVAEHALGRISFFIAAPALMFTVVSDADLGQLFGLGLAIQAMVVALAAGLYVLASRLWMQQNPAHTTVGAAASAYVNSNNMGLPIAVFVLGNASAVVPVLLLNLLVISPIMLLILDIHASAAPSWKLVLTSPIRHPVIIGSALGAVVAVSGWQLPLYVYEPLSTLGSAAIPMILMSFGMSLHGSRFLRPGTGRRAVITAAAIKSLVMPCMAWVLARWVFDLPQAAVMTAVVIAGLPTAQNVYNYAARFGTGTVLARDTVVLTTALSPLVLAVAAVAFGP